jgi:Type II secretion system (T2SS), protein E, N-terminal domain
MEKSFEVSFLRVLVDLKFIPAEDAVRLLESFHESDIDQFNEFLLSEGIIGQENLLEALSEYFQIPSFDVEGYFFETHLLRMFPKEMLLKNEIIPLQVDENIMIMIAAKPDNSDLLFEIGEHVSYDIRFYVGIARDICDAVKEFYDKADTEDNQDEDVRQEHLLMEEFLHIEDDADVVFLVENEEDSFE